MLPENKREAVNRLRTIRGHLFGDFGKNAKRPEGAEVPVELMPKEPGTCEFTCGMAMLRGRLVVEPA